MINPLLYFLFFLKASLFSTGGFSNLPSLHQDMIASGWAVETDFGESIAIGQISPGPNGLWVISLGYFTYGYLGAALALMVEVFSAALVGTHFAFEASSFLDDKGGPPQTGQLIIAIDPSGFGHARFAERMEKLAEAIESQQGARLPGARRLQLRSKAERDGLAISKEIWNLLA